MSVVCVVKTQPSLSSLVMEEPSGCFPLRPCVSSWRMGTPVPSYEMYMVGTSWQRGSSLPGEYSAKDGPMCCAMARICEAGTSAPA